MIPTLIPILVVVVFSDIVTVIERCSLGWRAETMIRLTRLLDLRQAAEGFGRTAL